MQSWKYLCGLFLIVVLVGCQSGDNKTKPEPQAEFSLTKFNSLLSRCDHIELVYFAQQGRITTENRNPTEISRFSLYVDASESTKRHCEAEGMVILRGKEQIVIELDYALKNCNFVQVKMLGETYTQRLTQEGIQFFEKFTDFPQP